MDSKESNTNINALELDAANDWFTRTGTSFWKQPTTKQRKIIEQYLENQNLSE